MQRGSLECLEALHVRLSRLEDAYYDVRMVAGGPGGGGSSSTYTVAPLDRIHSSCVVTLKEAADGSDVWGHEVVANSDARDIEDEQLRFDIDEAAPLPDNAGHGMTVTGGESRYVCTPWRNVCWYTVYQANQPADDSIHYVVVLSAERPENPDENLAALDLPDWEPCQNWILLYEFQLYCTHKPRETVIHQTFRWQSVPEHDSSNEEEIVFQPRDALPVRRTGSGGGSDDESLPAPASDPRWFEPADAGEHSGGGIGPGSSGIGDDSEDEDARAEHSEDEVVPETYTRPERWPVDIRGYTPNEWPRWTHDECKYRAGPRM